MTSVRTVAIPVLALMLCCAAGAGAEARFAILAGPDPDLRIHRVAAEADKPAADKSAADKPAADKPAEISGPEIEACDRVAAHPFDPEKPAAIAGVPFDQLSVTAMVACRKAAEVKDAPRRIPYELGRIYDRLGNHADAATAYAKAANRGHLLALHNLGLIYKSGKGVGKDLSLARAYLERAVEGGYPGSAFEIAIMYQEGVGMPRNYAMARQYLEKSAAMGDGRGHNNLGQLYWGGLGVKVDRTEACRHFREGAKLGDGTAVKNRDRLCRGR